MAQSRDFNELLVKKMRAANLISMLPHDLQHALIQQVDKIEDIKSIRDRVATIVEAKLALKNPDAMEHGARDCWTKHKDEANNGRTDVGEVEEDIGGFEIGCVDKEKMYPPGLQISNRFQVLSDEDEPNVCPVEKQRTNGRIIVDSGEAESVWPEGLMPEIQTKPSVGSQTGVTHIAASGNRTPNLGEKKVHFKTKDGLNTSIAFQVTKVKKPLAAVSKITEKGNWVCFGPSETYIENVATGKRTDLELHNGTSAWTWSTSMRQVLRGWAGGKEFDKPSKPKSVSPCGEEICVDDVSESEDLGHGAQPSASCGTDGERAA